MEHQERYLALLKNIEAASIPEAEKVRWRCRNCGFIHEGTKALAKCPICDHPNPSRDSGGQLLRRLDQVASTIGRRVPC
jgi:rubrerythrin